jgi:general secretion pathway protein I
LSAPRHRLVRGFTLIEVVVALFIIVVVLAALFRQINSVANTSHDLRQRTLAQWIALNRVVEIRMSCVPPVGQKTDGKLDYANQKWRWHAEILPTTVKNFVHIRVQAGLDSAPKDTWISTADGFCGAAIVRGVATIPWQSTPGQTSGTPAPVTPGAPVPGAPSPINPTSGPGGPTQ